MNPAHILATRLFAEDQPAQIMLAKSRRVKEEGGNRAKPSLISSASVCATCFQTGLKPCIFFLLALPAMFLRLVKKQDAEFLPSFFSSLQITAYSVQYVWAKAVCLNLLHFPLTTQVFLQPLYFYFELLLLAKISLFFTCLWLYLTVTESVHFP